MHGASSMTRPDEKSWSRAQASFEIILPEMRKGTSKVLRLSMSFSFIDEQMREGHLFCAAIHESGPFFQINYISGISY